VRSSHSIASNGGTVASEYRRVNVKPRKPREGRSVCEPAEVLVSRPVPTDDLSPPVPVSRSVALISRPPFPNFNSSKLPNLPYPSLLRA